MIIYVTDRNLNILIHASTELRTGYLITNDLTTESIDSGASIFECTVYANDQNALTLQNLVENGFYILKSKDIKTNDPVTIYNSLYQIIDTEYNILERKLTIYAEDAGLDLINTVVPAFESSSSQSIQNYASIFMPNDWEIYNDDIGNTALTLSWESENTLTERLLSIANNFNAELYYAFTINGFQIIEKSIHFVKRRGSAESIAQLRMNYDINNITIRRSIENLATALAVTGGSSEVDNTVVNLIGYSYSYTDDKGDIYSVDTSTGQMRCLTQMTRWQSELDKDGLIVKQFRFDTTDKSILAGEARAALQKLVYPEINYDVDIIKLPEDVRVGDTINIIADNNYLYLEARVLQLQTSVINQSIKAVLGDYLIKDSGISKYLEELANKFAQDVKDNQIWPINIWMEAEEGSIFGEGNTINATLHAVVKIANTECRDYNTLNNMIINYKLASSWAVKWYKDGVHVGNGLNYNLSSNADLVKMQVTLYLN